MSTSLGALLVKVANDECFTLGILKTIGSADWHQSNDTKVENGDQKENDDEARENGQGEPDGTILAVQEANGRLFRTIVKGLNLKALNSESSGCIA